MSSFFLHQSSRCKEKLSLKLDLTIGKPQETIDCLFTKEIAGAKNLLGDPLILRYSARQKEQYGTTEREKRKL